MRFYRFAILSIAISFFLATAAMAHTPMCSCWDNGDGTITCEGGFSDGGSAAGVEIYVEQEGEKIESGEMDDNSEFTFDKPEGDYTVVFDAGKGHKVKNKGSEIY
ncbi:MAG: hypothetical protein ACLFT5_07530 [Desulfovermiculus sp.]